MLCPALANEMAVAWSRYLYVERYLEEHPAAMTQMDDTMAIWVVGLPRTGSTSMQAGLSQHPSVWTFDHLDASVPVPMGLRNFRSVEEFRELQKMLSLAYKWLMPAADWEVHPVSIDSLAEDFNVRVTSGCGEKQPGVMRCAD